MNSISNSDIELEKYLDELMNINNSNKKNIDNFSKYFLLLDKIEKSIKIKVTQELNDLIEIKDSIDENIETFKKICINTKHV